MCHLTGYIGKENCIPLLLDSLEIQESIIGAQATGLAFIENHDVYMEKYIGPAKRFRELHQLKKEPTIGIGHTRYAIKNVTHAETNTQAKAHPFWNSNEFFVTMHNGTLTNYKQFVNDLEEKGYKFRSKSKFFDKNLNREVIDYCDSEIFSYLLEEELKKTNDIQVAIRNSCKDFQGHFAFVVLHPKYPEQIFLANWMQPMYLGYSEESTFFSSFEIGLSGMENILPCKCQPPHNVLITLSKGDVSIERLLNHHEPPEFTPNEIEFEEAILNALKDNHNDIASIWIFIQNNCRDIGLSPGEFEQLSSINGYTFSPLIYNYLLELEKENRVVRKLEYVWEGGIKETPRYKFYSK